jgi:hypothetical protein
LPSRRHAGDDATMLDVQLDTLIIGVMIGAVGAPL